MPDTVGLAALQKGQLSLLRPTGLLLNPVENCSAILAQLICGQADPNAVYDVPV